MMIPTYSHNLVTVNVTLPSPFNPYVALQGNRNRVSLIISSSYMEVGATVGYTIDQRQLYSVVAWTSPFNQVFTYRDFGPLIREPVVISAGGYSKAFTISIVEVSKVG